MDRFTENPFPSAPRDRDEDGFDASYSCAVLRCESCGCTAERLTTMPAYKLSPALQACDQCMAEDVIAQEAVAERMVILSESGCTPAEAIAFIKAVA